MDDPTSDKPAFNTESTPNSNNLRTVKSEDLFQGEKKILIRHGEDLYIMRITRNGKLIMTK